MPHQPASSALQRFRVIDLTQVRAGPTACRQLADWGADVIQVQMPESMRGDDTLGGQEGSDYFQELVKAGEGVEKRGKKRIDKELDAANHQIDEAAEEVSRVRGKVEIQLDKIEKAFDARVGRALNRLGIPSKHDVEALSIKLEQLHELLERVAHKP